MLLLVQILSKIEKEQDVLKNTYLEYYIRMVKERNFQLDQALNLSTNAYV